MPPIRPRTPQECPGPPGQLDAESKGVLFSQTFAAKARLQEPPANQFSTLPAHGPEVVSGLLLIRVREAKSVLKQLKEDSSTRPDRPPSKIRKQCCYSLAVHVAMLARTVLNTGIWQSDWRLHWIRLSHKKFSKSTAKHYRRIHLTSDVLKIVERLLGSHLLPFLVSTQAFWPNQIAYTP